MRLRRIQFPLFALAACLASPGLPAQPPAEPPAIAVRFQDAVALLAQGERGRLELEAHALPTDQLDSVRQLVRQATSSLESLDKDIKNDLLIRRRAAPKSGELSADELSRLTEQVHHQQARAHKTLGLLFEPGSDDRLSLLLAARDILQRAAPPVPEGDPLKTAMLLDLIECHRLLGRYAEAAELATSLDRDTIPLESRHRARAELIRAEVGQKNLATVQRLLEQAPASDHESPELALAHVEAFLTLARTSPDLATRLQPPAARTVEQLAKNHRPYWAHRAGQLLADEFPHTAITNVELLSRAADALYLRSSFDQSISAYAAAADQATNQTDNQRAFELACKAALVEQKLERHSAATHRLRSLAKSQPSHPQAAQAHLLAAWNAAQHAERDLSSAALYEELLREHVATWPTAESTDQARLWLGALCETKQLWTDASEAYQGVSPTSPHSEAAARGLLRCRQARGP